MLMMMISRYFLKVVLSYFVVYLSCSPLVFAEGMEKKITKLACIGDSITFGARVKNRKQNAYPFQLAKMLGENWEIRNYGVGGMTMFKTKKRSSYWRSGQLEKIKVFEPDVITIMLGTNDALQINDCWLGRERFIKDYKLMIHELRKIKSNPTIYICYPVPAYPGDRGKRELVLESEVLPGIDTVAKAYDLTVIDLFKPLSGKRKLFPDKIHPNADGQTLIAQEIFKVLQSKIR